VGFGGYTSIVTNACRDIVASDIGLTSGNSLTSAAALEALFMAADRIGVRRRRLGVLGAGGNIGMVLAEAGGRARRRDRLIGREGPRAAARLQGAATSLAERLACPSRWGPASRRCATAP
jgi:predicted amino acid dehydrogenase